MILRRYCLLKLIAKEMFLLRPCVCCEHTSALMFNDFINGTDICFDRQADDEHYGMVITSHQNTVYSTSIVENFLHMTYIMVNASFDYHFNKLQSIGIIHIDMSVDYVT